MKTSVSYRLSEQAVSNLQAICRETGSNQTAAVENALGFYAAQFKKGENIMSEKMDRVLEYLGTSVSESDVHQEFDGKTQDEILETLNEWFPGEDNDNLANLISDVVR